MWLAFSFLTTLPVPGLAARKGAAETNAPLALGRAAIWFPLVGLVLGLLLAGALWLLARIFPPLLAAALLVTLWAALTGALHLDGLADCGDGLLAATTRDRRLEILRDPRLGSFGALSLVFFVLLKVLAVASLVEGSLPSGQSLGMAPAAVASRAGGLIVLPLVLATVTGRWLILLAARQPGARPEGLGAAFARGLGPAALWVAGAFTLGAAFLGGWRGLSAVAAAHLAAAFVFRAARTRLGGLTGDVFGLTVEVAELTVLLVFAAHSPL